MKAMIFTIVGQDKPGLIDSLAQTIYKLGGNWLGSNFAHMAGHFAGFVHVELPQNNHRQLIDTLSAHPDLQIHLVQGKDTDIDTQTTATIEILGNDKPGIVQELTSVLNQFNINIVKFDSSCEPAPNWGGQLFKAQARITMSAEFDPGQLQHALEAIANDLVVDISIHH